MKRVMYGFLLAGAALILCRDAASLVINERHALSGSSANADQLFVSQR